MKERFQNPDALIDEHTNRQLSGVDWNHLYDKIQKKLDAAEKPKPIVSMRGNLFRAAVGISAAAAILLVVFVLFRDGQKPLPLPPGRRAVVALSEQHSVAEVQIRQSAVSVSINLPDSQTAVQFEPSDIPAAQCRITIIDRNGQTEKQDAPQPSWIIMTASKPAASQNRTERDQLDIACML